MVINVVILAVVRILNIFKKLPTVFSGLIFQLI